MVGYFAGMDTTPPPVVPFSSTVPEEKGLLCACLVSVVTICVIVGGTMSFIVWMYLTAPHFPCYSVAIDSSGLASNRTDLALDPEFNLTLRIASTSRDGDDACVEPGTYLVVAYRCVTLATSATAKHRLCATRPRKEVEQQFLARGTGVRVPGTMMDSLMEDLRQGEPVFQVTIRQSGGWYADDKLVASCGGRRVGAARDDLGASCDAWPLCP